MFDFQEKKNRYKMTAAALFTVAAMCVGGCGDAAATRGAAVGSTTADTGASTSDTSSAAAAAWHESGMETDKEESVYVLADAYGTPAEITVTTGLKNPGPDAELTDVTTLTDIVNKEGDET